MHNYIILPKEIDGDYFQKFYEELMDIIEEHKPEEGGLVINVFCDGYGGEWLSVMSVINTIQQYSDVITFYGIVQSNCISGHSMIWSSIPNRTCGEFGEVCIHDTAVITMDEPLSLSKLEKLVSQGKRKLNVLASIYSKACLNKKYNSKMRWFEEIYGLQGEFLNLGYVELKNRGMITYE